MSHVKSVCLQIDNPVTDSEYGDLQNAKTTLMHPTIHHPISDIIITTENPFGMPATSTAENLAIAEVRLIGYLQATTHMGLTYVMGLTPEIVTSSMGLKDVRNGTWFPCYRALSASTSDPAFVYASELMIGNKFFSASTSGGIERPERTDAMLIAYTASLNTLASLPVTRTRTVAEANTADRVVLIKDASGTLFFCPLVQPGTNWNGEVIRPVAFGGHGRMYRGNAEYRCVKYLSAPSVTTTFLKLKDGGVKATSIFPKLRSPPTATPLADDSTGKEVVDLLFDALRPVLPTSKPSHIPFGTTIFSTIHTSALITKDLVLDHILIDYDKRGDLNDLTSVFVKDGAASFSTLPAPQDLWTSFFFDVDDPNVAGVGSSSVAIAHTPFCIGSTPVDGTVEPTADVAAANEAGLVSHALFETKFSTCIDLEMSFKADLAKYNEAVTDGNIALQTSLLASLNSSLTQVKQIKPELDNLVLLMQTSTAIMRTALSTATAALAISAPIFADRMASNVMSITLTLGSFPPARSAGANAVGYLMSELEGLMPP